MIIKLHRNGNLMMMNWISCHEFEFRPGDSDLHLAEPQARASRDLSRPGGESDGTDNWPHFKLVTVAARYHHAANLTLSPQ